MNDYQPTRFHAGAGIAAGAMMVLTLAITVVLPMHLAATGPDSATLTGPARHDAVATEVAIIPARIDVVGSRDTTLAERMNKPHV
jgi:Mg2+/Co2+ transporter CorB